MTRDGKGRLLGDVLRGVFAARGIDLERVDARPQCVTGCRTPVGRDGAWCPRCAAADVARLRSERLVAARASLPDWPWCKAGDPGFEALRSAAPEIFEAVREWRLGGGSLVLLGSTGIGKTAAMVWKANIILDAAGTGRLPQDKFDVAAGLRFVSVADIAHARRNHPLGEGDPPILLMAQSAPLLLLDEVGRESVGDMIVFELVDQRYRAGLPTIMTSNLLQADMHERYGAAGKRRLLRLGRVVEVRKEPA